MAIDQYAVVQYTAQYARHYSSLDVATYADHVFGRVRGGCSLAWLEHDPHEESTGVGVAELLCLKDVASLCGDMARYRSNDARLVRAGPRQ